MSSYKLVSDGTEVSFKTFVQTNYDFKILMNFEVKLMVDSKLLF